MYQSLKSTLDTRYQQLPRRLVGTDVYQIGADSVGATEGLRSFEEEDTRELWNSV
jgi:hypothetical protein